MPMNQMYRMRMIILVIFTVLAVVACRPDDNLDITPSPTFTPPPTATPSPTPEPEGFEAEIEQNTAVLEALGELLPKSIPAGAAQWKWDYSRAEEGVEDLLNVTNGIGHKIYFNEQTGGQMSMTFAVFDTPEDALANYERIKGIRSVLENGEFDDTFPDPNIFGSGLYGSVALFQIDNYFIEVSIELFSSTSDNPLVPISRAAIRFFEENREAFESVVDDSNSTDSADTGDGMSVLDTILENIPNEIVTSTQWRRDFTQFDGVQTPPNVENGQAFRVFYGDQTANAFNMTFGEFDSADDALAHYEKMKSIREGIDGENTVDDFPQPHVIGRGLYGSVALFAIDQYFIEVLIERAPGTSANPTESIARKALALLNDAREQA